MSTSPRLEHHLKALGVPFRIVATGTRAAEVIQATQRAWGAATSEPYRHATSIEVCLDPDPERIAEALVRGAVASPSLDVLMDLLSPRVTTEAIAARAGELLMFHAGAVADDVGNVVGLVGPSGAGKTTATRILAQHLRYVTDETLGVREDLSIEPYPKPLSIIEAGPGKSQCSPESLGLETISGAGQLVGLVVLAREEGLTSAETETVSLSEAMAVVAAETSFLTRLSRPLHRLAGVLDQCGGLRRVHYGEASQLEPVVKTLLGHPLDGGAGPDRP